MANKTLGTRQKMVYRPAPGRQDPRVPPPQQQPKARRRRGATPPCRPGADKGRSES